MWNNNDRHEDWKSLFILLIILTRNCIRLGTLNYIMNAFTLNQAEDYWSKWKLKRSSGNLVQIDSDIHDLCEVCGWGQLQQHQYHSLFYKHLVTKIAHAPNWTQEGPMIWHFTSCLTVMNSYEVKIIHAFCFTKISTSCLVKGKGQNFFSVFINFYS